MPISIDAGGDQHVGVDHSAALADLHRQRVRGQERVGAGVQWAGAEVLDVGVELACHHRDLRLGEPGDAEGLDQLLHPSGGDPEQVAGRDYGGQRSLGPPAALEQPVREVGTLAQFRDRDLHGPGAGVEVPGPVAVAGVGPLRTALPIGGPADRVGLGRHQRRHERGQHAAQQVGLGTLQVLGQERRQINRVGVDGHRRDLLQSCFRRSSEGSRGGRRCVRTPRSHRARRTPRPWTQLGSVVLLSTPAVSKRARRDRLPSSSTRISGTAPAASPLPERSLGLIGHDGRPRMR